MEISSSSCPFLEVVGAVIGLGGGRVGLPVRTVGQPSGVANNDE